MKLTYRRCGDYYLPNFGVPVEDTRPLGKYGRMRFRYLQEHRNNHAEYNTRSWNN